MMKRACLILAVLFACLSLASCGAFEALSYSLSGDIIDPAPGFARGDEAGTLAFGGNTYVLIKELNGKFYFDKTEEYLFLGQTSNFPFFPNSAYYANAKENADYIAGGSSSNQIMTFVYLRKDLYQAPVRYLLEGTEYDFAFSSAFLKTEEVSYEGDVEGKDHPGTYLSFSLQDYPSVTAEIHLCKIKGRWYYIKPDEAFALSQDFLNALTENGLLP